MSTWRFPTLADVPRAQWPDTLVVSPPAPGRTLERIRCRCKVPHEAEDVFDLRAVAGMPAFLCTHCLHARIYRGVITWGALARALGAPAALLANYDAADVDAIAQGLVAAPPVALPGP